MFVPFSNLNDMISGGILISFNMTNSALILVRRDSADRIHNSSSGAFLDSSISPAPVGISANTTVESTSLLENLSLYRYIRFETSCEAQLVCFHIFSIVFSFSATYFWYLCALLAISVLILCTFVIYMSIPDALQESSSQEHYMVPFVPFTPLFGILVNYFLLAQLSATGLVLICTYIACAVISYYLFGFVHSVGNNSGWRDLLRDKEDEEESRNFNNPTSNSNLVDSKSPALDTASSTRDGGIGRIGGAITVFSVDYSPIPHDA